jgi:uncharacterized membrane protein YesL
MPEIKEYSINFTIKIYPKTVSGESELDLTMFPINSSHSNETNFEDEIRIMATFSDAYEHHFDLVIISFLVLILGSIKLYCSVFLMYTILKNPGFHKRLSFVTFTMIMVWDFLVVFSF